MYHLINKILLRIKQIRKKIWKHINGKYKTFKTGYFDRSPRGKWLLIRDAGSFFLKWCGAQILDPNYKVWWLSYAPTIVTIDLLVSSIYSFWYFMKSDLMKSFLSIPIFFGILIPVNENFFTQDQLITNSISHSTVDADQCSSNSTE